MMQPYLGRAWLLNNLATDFPDTVPDVDALKSSLETIGLQVTSYKDRNFQVGSTFLVEISNFSHFVFK